MGRQRQRIELGFHKPGNAGVAGSHHKLEERIEGGFFLRAFARSTALPTS